MSTSTIPKVFWFFGLSGSGKSTLSNRLGEALKSKGLPVFSIDGDQLRQGINKDLGFSSDDRKENIRRAAEISKLMSDNNQIVLASFITPEESHRDMVSQVLGNTVRFIFVEADLKTCRQRDVKGLYRQVDEGSLAQFTGVSAPFVRPKKVDLVLDTTMNSVDECLTQLLHTFFHNR